MFCSRIIPPKMTTNQCFPTYSLNTALVNQSEWALLPFQSFLAEATERRSQLWASPGRSNGLRGFTPRCFQWDVPVRTLRPRPLFSPLQPDAAPPPFCEPHCEEEDHPLLFAPFFSFSDKHLKIRRKNMINWMNGCWEVTSARKKLWIQHLIHPL